MQIKRDCAVSKEAWTEEEKSACQVRRRVEVFRALGHPSRIRILELLACGEACVCEIVPLVGSDFSTVSRHLSVLRHAGLIADDKRGQKVFYRLTAPCVLDFMECLDRNL